MSILKVIDVKFEGGDYKIKKNMYTMHLFAEELKKHEGDNNEFISIILFAWSALKGYNKDFNLSVEEVAMNIDSEGNESLVAAINELFKIESEEALNKAEGDDDIEKK